MTQDGLQYRSIRDLSVSVRNRDLTAETLCRATLERIHALNGRLHGYVAVMAETALEQAALADAEIERGQYRGPLHGIPIGLKDLIFTQDCATEAGTAIHRGFRPARDATVVERLKQAGAVVIGKTTMTEAGGMVHHPQVAPAINPFGPEIWAGASSSGSGVATAAGLCAASLGSDTGGSIRSPSACNGLTGLRPTWGRVSRFGIFDLSQSCDTIGPMARSVEDAAIVLSAIAGFDPLDPTSLGPDDTDFQISTGIDGARGKRIGFDRNYITRGASDETVTMIDEVLERLVGLGAELVPIQLPDTEELVTHAAHIHMAEQALAHADTFPSHANLYGPWLRRGLERGRALDPVQLARAGIARDRFRGELTILLSSVDAMLLPVFVGGTPSRSEAERMASEEPHAIFRFTIPSAAAGVPSLTLPARINADGRPAGFQLLAKHWSERALLRIGQALQCATDWHLARPPLL